MNFKMPQPVVGLDMSDLVPGDTFMLADEAFSPLLYLYTNEEAMSEIICFCFTENRLKTVYRHEEVIKLKYELTFKMS